MGRPLRQPTAIERLGIPRGIMQEMVQALPVGARYDRAQLDQGLIMLARQEQPNEVLAQRRAFLVAGQEVVEVGTELIGRLGGGVGRFTGRGHAVPSFPIWPLVRSARVHETALHPAAHDPCQT